MILNRSIGNLFRPVALLIAVAVCSFAAGYKIRPWKARAIESYASTLASEGVTIAVDPLFTDSLAAQVFDRPDMLARGIMPLAIVIFNSNDFPVEVDGPSIELQWDQERRQSVDPIYAVQCLYESKPTRRIVVPLPIPPIKIQQSHADACQDFKAKYLAVKRVEPHATAGGFLFLQVKDVPGLRQVLESAKVYIPNICNGKTGKEMMFFEIDLKPAIDAAPKK
jgi:hypothetical protein